MTDDPTSKNPRGDDPNEMIAELLRQMGITPGADGQLDLGALLGRLQQQMSAFGMGGAAGSASGVNWEHTKHLTRQLGASQGPDPTPVDADRRQVTETARLAELWLDQACDFSQVPGAATAWSRAEWIEGTMAAWQQVSEPVVGSIATAMGALIGGGAGAELPPELGALGGMLAPMMRQAAGTMYAMQLAQAISTLSGQALTGTEIGFQLLAQPKVTVLTTNVASFAEGLEVSREDLTLYLVLREAARQRLFHQVGWLAPQMLALVEHYAREIKVDSSALEQAIDVDDMTQLTPEKMAEISENLQGKLFEPTQSAEQVEILGRLETLVALVEGWVDEVVSQAAGTLMPSSVALAETIRRRRAAGGPAEQVLSSLLGLELRPRRIRDAANLWAALTVDRGVGGRDAVWHHPDLIPSAADLDDPLGYVSGEARTSETDDLDAELAKLLAESAEERTDEDGDSPAS